MCRYILMLRVKKSMIQTVYTTVSIKRLLLALCSLSDNWQLLVKHPIKHLTSSPKHLSSGPKHLSSIYKASDRQVQSMLDRCLGPKKSNVWQTSVRCFILACQMCFICLTDALACLTDALGCLSDVWRDASQAVVNCLTRSTKQIACALRKWWYTL